MEDQWIALAVSALALLASVVSVELGLSIAIVEIILGVIAGNVLGLHSTPWIDFLASFAGILLTFLAGAEVDLSLMREKARESIIIGLASFLTPFLAVLAFCYYIAGWNLQASLIGGITLSETSVAVVYAVLVETGLTRTPIGKMIMSSTFATNFGTAAALSLFFTQPSLWMLAFVLFSATLIVVMPRLQPWFFQRYGNRVTEPEIKGAFAALFALMFFAGMAKSLAVLPALLLGLAVARIFVKHREEQARFRVVAFTLLTPFFFIKSGMGISLSDVWANLGLMLALFVVKLGAKIGGVLPQARRYVRGDAMYTTLLLGTGLTFGNIAALWGLNAGIINSTQFSLLVTAVILSAVIPAIIAQRHFEPKY
ncbi:MAG: cation:proton antiporter [Chloroflexi bacterium]|nr:cation:proton antiporter [Chloroflexota bacterium]